VLTKDEPRPIAVNVAWVKELLPLEQSGVSIDEIGTVRGPLIYLVIQPSVAALSVSGSRSPSAARSMMPEGHACKEKLS
jgi:hypothetical protein